ncbi:aminopeptidase Y precursor vacuolar [Fusarium beomiforme]|uniref:Peptide hydrolase n=1 Tax=Fusarium beomiforme TaxID=44412 RepID=A0A9P5APE7_9HYPO|nr:aminopeptidase Y precursor vacuolar [Fusarium beomiforme]
MRLSGGIAALLSLALSHGLAKRHKLESQKFQDDIETRNLVITLEALNAIAFTNGGNRAFGLPGYEASVDYIYRRTSKVTNAKVWKQTFSELFNFIDSIELSVDDKPIDVYGLAYSPSTTKAGITAEIALGPEGAAGCDTSSYHDRDVKGKIVLVGNFPCRTSESLAGRVLPAAAAGASAVIIYDNLGVNAAAGSLGKPNPEGLVPAGLISHIDALKFKDRIEAGETVKAHFQHTQTIEERLTQNIMAETTGGDPRNVIMLGAHLDSVQGGPGMNDNGSGSSLILELFLALSKYKTKNKIRFAWWGAEENGLLGSKHYTSNLSADDVDNLLVYLNFDMVAKGFFGVADTDGSSFGCKAPEGSEATEKIFVEYFTNNGIEVTPVGFTNGSDYAPFWRSLKKPFGYLHTGTAVGQDPCYHKACDTIDNIDFKTLTLNTKAAAHILAVLDERGTMLIPKAKSTTTMLKGL